ncbi:MAG: hypothetical protein HNEKOMLI_00306 [Sodalis sp. Psp]|nr:hypothetical protein [Sodalis sp. Psp]MCR3756801.1 hypothetical protein [Sodalis sp. Ppy]
MLATHAVTWAATEMGVGDYSFSSVSTVNSDDNIVPTKDISNDVRVAHFEYEVQVLGEHITPLLEQGNQ